MSQVAKAKRRDYFPAREGARRSHCGLFAGRMATCDALGTWMVVWKTAGGLILTRKAFGTLIELSWPASAVLESTSGIRARATMIHERFMSCP